MLTTVHIIGILLTVGILLAVSILSGRKVKDAHSFTTGGRAGSWMVCGAILGTLVGGQSTIGTAQLAFAYGLSAWWFTIGAALGALVLGVLYAGPLRRSGCTTLMEVVRQQYGRRAETVGSVLFLIGIFISITSQLLSSSAMIGSLFDLPLGAALAIGAVLIAALVFFGGIRSAGTGGIVKLVLLYVSSLAAGIAVWKIGGGLTGIRESITSLYETPRLASMNDIACAEDIHRRYGTFLSRGPLKDLGGCLSLTLGVVCTQTYAQAVWSAASTCKARRGAIYCAALIPLIGAACTLVGMYMRGHYVTSTEAAALQNAGIALPDGVGVLENSLQAFPTFILAHLPRMARWHSPWNTTHQHPRLRQRLGARRRHHPHTRRLRKPAHRPETGPALGAVDADAHQHHCPAAAWRGGRPFLPRVVHQRPRISIARPAGRRPAAAAELRPVAAWTIQATSHYHQHDWRHRSHAPRRPAETSGRPYVLRAHGIGNHPASIHQKTIKPTLAHSYFVAVQHLRSPQTHTTNNLEINI